MQHVIYHVSTKPYESGIFLPYNAFRVLEGGIEMRKQGGVYSFQNCLFKVRGKAC